MLGTRPSHRCFPRLPLVRRWSLAVAPLLVACGTESTPDSSSASFPVVGGTPVAGECAWPSTVQVNAATGCTGTLIHPRIVTTAAHCLRSGGGSARITFGGSGRARFDVTATCKAGAMGESGVSTGRDWAYCVLPEDARIQALPRMAPIVGCEADKFLKAGGNAWIVGIGATGANGAGFGVLRQVEVKINRVNASVLDVGDAQKGACHGDSGGPLYVQLRDGSRDYGWRLAGATSGPGGNCDCTCSSVYVNIAMHVAAIEKNEGIDVTPCTDATGAWAPGPECNQMQKEPSSAAGTFPNCVVTRTMEPIESCGAGVVSGGAGGNTSSGGVSSSGGTGGVGGTSLGGRDGAGAGGIPPNTGGVAGANGSGGRSSGGSAAGGTNGGGSAGTTGGEVVIAGGSTSGGATISGGAASGGALASGGASGGAAPSSGGVSSGGNASGGVAIVSGGAATTAAGSPANSGVGNTDPAVEVGCGCRTSPRPSNDIAGVALGFVALGLIRWHRRKSTRPATRLC